MDTINVMDRTTTAVEKSFAAGTVRSKDGTTIGYRRVGDGPGLILVQGAMGTAENFTQLGKALADAFTVYMPDRRGRGLSGPGESEFSILREVEDVEALINHAGVDYIFGLSSGALIALQSTLTLPVIRRAAIYEPPLFVNGLPTALMVQYEKEMAEGKLAAALITAMKATQMGPRAFNVMPRWLLEILTTKAMESQDRNSKTGDVTMRMLAPTLRNDFRVVAEMHGALESFSAIRTDVLLMGGSESPNFLKVDLGALEKVLSHAKRIEFHGLGHAAAWNFDKRMNPQGRPELVAQELRRFFE
jgi:pimeloyl-ACP methyl ester carboxylesterase